MHFERLEQRRLFAISAVVQTTPVPTLGDSADDVAIWVHPTDPSLSAVIGTDRGNSQHQGTGLYVYGLDGSIISHQPETRVNNVDLRYNFPLGGENVTLVAASDEANNCVRLYKMNAETRSLEDVTAAVVPSQGEIEGISLYRSAQTGSFYALTTFNGALEQWELSDNGEGKVGVTLVRTIVFAAPSSDAEGVVADDEHGVVYVSEENVGIWKFDAEPDGSSDGALIDTVAGGRLTPDIEGLAIYRAANGAGYLIASSQGDDSFVVYDRVTHAPVTKFTIVAAGKGKNAIDEVTHTDGIEVSSFGLNDTFANGLFVAQDNKTGNGAKRTQNFKLVRWEDIAAEHGLLVDTSQDPRVYLPPTNPPVSEDPVEPEENDDLLGAEELL